MQKMPAFNQNNQPLEIEIVRYFKKDDKKYLIFTLGEKDEQNYIKVYVSKILGLNGTLAAYDIIDETEWAGIKDLVKKIIKANREGEILDIEDLSTERLVNIKINGQQVFKLIHNLIELLGSNIIAKRDEDDTDDAPSKVLASAVTPGEVGTVSINDQEEVPQNIPMDPIPSHISADYQQLYKELFDKYQVLIEENTKLKTQLTSIQAIINE